MVPPTVKVVLPTSVNGISKVPHKHPQRLVSMVLLDLTKLTKEINHHRLTLCFHSRDWVRPYPFFLY